ncbi:MAG: acyl-CoA reductase-like NAD-dependent aldehyde dehydrogenase [Halioglobus sp.]|jgi:acyl-CoA reductase-like NAD-dependent aldehyde dehydrogenase
MTEHFPLMITGPESTGNFKVTSPYHGAVLATVEQCGEQHIEEALALAFATFRDRDAWPSVAERRDILERTASLMQDQAEALALGAAAEGGKPLMDSRVEVSRAIEGVKMCAEHISAHAGEVIPLQEPQPNTMRMGFTQKEPIGVVVSVSAFNHPLNLIVHQVGAAIAAGCPVIVKPAEDTPLSCLRFVKLLREAGLPEAWCQVALPESLTLASTLVTDSRVAFFSFIGSARVGWMLRSKLAPGTRCALEHGGVAPVIVDETADLDKAVPAILKGGFYHAGQVCVSVQRVFAHHSIAKELSERLVSGANALKVGDPLDEETEVGPLIRPAEIARIDSWIQEAVTAGAAALCGAYAMDNNCYAPTVLYNPSPLVAVSTREIFGPLVCVYEYHDVNTAIDAANDLEVAFQAAVFSQDIDRAMHIYQRIDASAVMINDHTAFRQDGMPFAGLRQSGLGVGGIGHTIDDMQIDKMLMIKATQTPG